MREHFSYDVDLMNGQLLLEYSQVQMDFCANCTLLDYDENTKENICLAMNDIYMGFGEYGCGEYERYPPET